MRDDIIISFVESIVPKLEDYRAKNVNKYYREMEQEYREYTKMERYKNRVRVVDIFLPALKGVLKNAGVTVPTDDISRDIP